MTDAQRLDEWQRVQRGEARVVVGARSARLRAGARPRADRRRRGARAVVQAGGARRATTRATWRSSARARAGAVCVLGSATPSLESWRARARGRYAPARAAAARAGGGRCRAVEIVDLRARARGERAAARCSRARLRAAAATSALAARRAGDPVPQPPRLRAGAVVPGAAARPLRCAQLRRRADLPPRARARWCATACCEERAAAEGLPDAAARRALRYLGVGTERVEDELAAAAARRRACARMDSDTMRRREDYEQRARAPSAAARSTCWSARR